MLAPLMFVVFVSMVKDAFEDYKRSQNDRRENESEIQCFHPESQTFQATQWQSLKVGNIVKVMEDEFMPCDMMLLYSTGTKGTCYVETKNLDGETNLKLKIINKEVNAVYPNDELSQWKNLRARIQCENPNPQLYKFEGNLHGIGRKPIALDSDNIVLRGMSVKNTEYMIGIVVFTGHETKVMKNSEDPKYKHSKLDMITNNTIKLVLLTQIVLAMIGGIAGFAMMSG